MFDEYGNFHGELPAECVRDCSHSGDCFEDVEYWRKRLDFQVPRIRAIAYLREIGAWPLESDQYDQGLADMPDEDLARKVLWLACCEIKEDGNWLGLIH